MYKILFLPTSEFIKIRKSWFDSGEDIFFSEYNFNGLIHVDDIIDDTFSSKTRCKEIIDKISIQVPRKKRKKYKLLFEIVEIT